MAKTKKQANLPPWLREEPDTQTPKGKGKADPEQPPAKGKKAPPDKGRKGK